jgi:hypothetical protein
VSVVVAVGVKEGVWVCVRLANGVTGEGVV